MLEAAHKLRVPEVASPKSELLEAHRSKISLTRARTGYDYPTIRLPFAFSRLIGLSTRIYQTIHDGALAFLVVVSSTSKSSPNLCEKPFSSSDAPRLHRTITNQSYIESDLRFSRVKPILSQYQATANDKPPMKIHSKMRKLSCLEDKGRRRNASHQSLPACAGRGCFRYKAGSATVLSASIVRPLARPANVAENLGYSESCVCE